MSRVFRKSRSQANDDNRIAKYLLYALGEILLVVVGIVIALRVNDWNEGRKDAERLGSVLLSIQREIRANMDRVLAAQERRIIFVTTLQGMTETLTEDDRRRKVFDVPEDERFAGWPGASPLTLDSAMFEAAKFGGMLADLDAPLLAHLSRVYGMQSTINELGRTFVNQLFEVDYDTRHGDVLRLLWRIQEEFFGGQYMLLEDYEEAIGMIRTRENSG